MERPKGRRLLGRPRNKWEDGTKINLHEVRWRGMDWIDLAQCGDRWRALMYAVMNFQIEYSAGNLLTS